MPATFDGFTPGTFAFLRGIAAHNNREWFRANRAAYEEHLLAPAMDLVVALGERLKHLSKDVHAEPRINGSIMRINRDTRFSKGQASLQGPPRSLVLGGQGPQRPRLLVPRHAGAPHARGRDAPVREGSPRAVPTDRPRKG